MTGDKVFRPIIIGFATVFVAWLLFSEVGRTALVILLGIYGACWVIGSVTLGAGKLVEKLTSKRF